MGDTLRWLFSLAVFAGMIALCVVLWNQGGVGGLIGGGVGLVLRLGGHGYDWRERLGNAYTGALMGLPIGLLLGGLYFFIAPQIPAAISAPS